MSLRDVICVAGDVRPFKADDILNTPAMQAIKTHLAEQAEYADGGYSGAEWLRRVARLPQSVIDWVLPPERPEQLELPEEFRWKLSPQVKEVT